MVLINADDYKELLAVEQEMVEAFNNGSKTLARFCTPDTSLLAMRKEAMGGHEGDLRLKQMKFACFKLVLLFQAYTGSTTL